MFINHPLTSATQQTPVLLVCSVWTLRTAHCGLHLNATNSDRFLDLSELPISVKVLTWMRASNSHLSEWKLLFITFPSWFIGVGLLTLHAMAYYEHFTSFPYIWWIIQLGHHFLCRLPTEFTKPKYSWSNDLLPFSEISLNGPLLWVLWRTARTRDVIATLSHHSNAHG